MFKAEIGKHILKKGLGADILSSVNVEFEIAFEILAHMIEYFSRLFPFLRVKDLLTPFIGIKKVFRQHPDIITDLFDIRAQPRNYSFLVHVSTHMKYTSLKRG
jgi:hypothetical protein